MITITSLAKQCGVSRATVLYYEQEGLLYPKIRSENGYRWYGEAEIKKLQSILRFRSFGVSVSDIANLIEYNNEAQQTEILHAQFEKIEQQILVLKQQQSAIVALLQQPELLEKNMVTKQRWVEIMRASGFDDQAMTVWHQNFEKMEPEEHQKFLELLGIDAAEIKKIRAM